MLYVDSLYEVLILILFLYNVSYCCSMPIIIHEVDIIVTHNIALFVLFLYLYGDFYMHRVCKYRQIAMKIP